MLFFANRICIIIQGQFWIRTIAYIKILLKNLVLYTQSDSLYTDGQDLIKIQYK